RQHLGERPSGTWRGDDARRIVRPNAVCAEETMKLPDGTETSRAARCRQPLPRERGQVGDDLLAACRRRRGPLRGKEGSIIIEVSPIGLDRVPGRAALGAHHLEERVDEVKLTHSTPGESVTMLPSPAAAPSASGVVAG